MNKQAAQTMPELPGPFDVIEQADRYNFVYTAAQMHQYARDYAAALSQTAGVTREWTPLDIQTFARAYKAEVPGAVLTVHGIDAGLHALAAAQAASGGEDDEDEAPTPTAMQIRYAEGYSDGVRDTERIAKERESSAASVSERARELLADVHNVEKSDIERHEATGDVAIRFALRAIEQALTQQRGECVAEVFEDSTGCRFPRWAPTVRQLPVPGTKLYTTPQPSADAVREVPDGMVLVPREPTEAMIDAWTVCNGGPADCYRAMLSAASGEKGVG